MVDGGFMKFTIRIVSWYWTMFRLFVPNLISVVLIIPRLEFDANLNSSYTIYPDWNLILISVVLILASQIGI